MKLNQYANIIENYMDVLQKKGKLTIQHSNLLYSWYCVFMEKKKK